MSLSQGSDFKLIAPLASSSSQLMSPSAQTPAQVPPHLVPSPLPLCPCPGRPQGHACFAGLWLLTAHGVASLCSARGGGLGVCREDILGPFSEGRSLGFSVLHAQGLGSNHPHSRRPPVASPWGSIPSKGSDQVRWGAQSLLPGQLSSSSTPRTPLHGL